MCQLAATLWWFMAAPKPLKIQVFGGSPSPQGSYSPYILENTTRPGHVTCVLVGSKSDRRRLRKTLHKQTNRHYENNGHLAVNQFAVDVHAKCNHLFTALDVRRDIIQYRVSLFPVTSWIVLKLDWADVGPVTGRLRLLNNPLSLDTQITDHTVAPKNSATVSQMCQIIHRMV